MLLPATSKGFSNALSSLFMCIPARDPCVVDCKCDLTLCLGWPGVLYSSLYLAFRNKLKFQLIFPYPFVWVTALLPMLFQSVLSVSFQRDLLSVELILLEFCVTYLSHEVKKTYYFVGDLDF